MVGDPGIEPGVRLREGVTVPCHTLRPVAHCVGVITVVSWGRQQENPVICGGKDGAFGDRDEEAYLGDR